MYYGSNQLNASHDIWMLTTGYVFFDNRAGNSDYIYPTHSLKYEKNFKSQVRVAILTN